MKNLAYHILDISENSFRAGAGIIELYIAEDKVKDIYSIRIRDNGSGMPPDIISKVTDPFFTSRTTRRVGMGIPLFQQNALQAGGSFEIKSQPGKGTDIHATFGLTNIDRPPVGDLPGVIVSLAALDEKVQFIYHHKTSEGEYIFDTKEISSVLEGIPFSNAKVQMLLKEMISENLKDIGAELE